MVWYLYSAIVANVSNALRTLVPRKQPSYQALFEGAKVLLCVEVVGQREMYMGPVHRTFTLAASYFRQFHIILLGDGGNRAQKFHSRVQPDRNVATRQNLS